VIDNLSMIAGFVGRSDGVERTIAISTTNPDRLFALTVDAERVSLSPGSESVDARLELPAESFIRLVYGRLDPGHTPSAVADDATLDQLRRLFPGV